MDRYLFVITRDLYTDPSAAYLARIAAATGRRRQEVVVYLAGSAICHDSLGLGRAMIERLRSAGTTLLIHPDLLRELGVASQEMGLQEADDQFLGELLLVPGMRAYWC